MKFRCTHNSIRLRLKKSDIAKLEQDGRLEVNVGFPGGSFLSYAIQISSSNAVEAYFESGKVELLIPEPQARQWISTDLVSMNTQLALPDGEQLSILIEKDFPCKDRTNEDKSDTFQELAARQRNLKC